MSERHYVLWLINAVQPWDKATLLQALRAPGVTSELGDREAPSGSMHGIDINDHATAKARPDPFSFTEYTPYGALMHERGHKDVERRTESSSLQTFDEYFVPIPVKCLGDVEALRAEADAYRRRIGREGTPNDAALNAILRAYGPAYFDAGADQPWQTYWTEGVSGGPAEPLDELTIVARRAHFDVNVANPPAHSPSMTPARAVLPGEVRMHSKFGVGYYSMLLRWNSRPGHADDRHILLGYSQGGIVGRFLAHLDEHVFGLGLVHGVFTVQSPNYGSPVAREQTAEKLEALLHDELPRVPWGVARLIAPKDYEQLLRKIEAAKGLKLAELDRFLRDQIRLIRREVALGRSRSAADARKHADALVSARKWLSGMVRSQTSGKFAFVDLDPERAALHDGGTNYVLRCINQGHGIAHGAVIGCNPDVGGLLGGGWASGFARFAARWLGTSIDHLTARYQLVFDTQRPTEPAAATQWWNTLATTYVNGLPAGAGNNPSLTLKKMAHDCVIPSSHQLMHLHKNAPTPEQGFFGNRVNPDANHATGTALKDAPESDLDLVVTLLRATVAFDGRLKTSP